MRRVSLAGLVVAVAVLYGCADDPPAPQLAPLQPATPAGLIGPWRPTPFLLDPALWARIESACRREIEMPAGSRAAVIDVRGAEVGTVRMTGQRAGSCNALQVGAAGQVAGAGGGWVGDGAEPLPPPLGDAEIGEMDQGSVGGGELKVQGWSVSGRAGAAIQSVVVVPANHPPVLATLRNGWFAAWWPRRAGEPELDAPPHLSFVIQGFDAAGALVAEVGP